MWIVAHLGGIMFTCSRCHDPQRVYPQHTVCTTLEKSTRTRAEQCQNLCTVDGHWVLQQMMLTWLTVLPSITITPSLSMTPCINQLRLSDYLSTDFDTMPFHYRFFSITRMLYSASFGSSSRRWSAKVSAIGPQHTSWFPLPPQR